MHFHAIPPTQTPYHKVDAALRQAGFERGWGNTVSRARETMNMLADLLEATDADLLQVRPTYDLLVVVRRGGCQISG